MAKWIFEPATGQLREVQAAAGGPGTGLNDGDWEWVAPANYRASAVGGAAVDSFNGRTGAVVPVAGDYTAAQVTPTAGAGPDLVIPGMTVAYAGPLPPAGWGIDAGMMAAVPLVPPQIWILKA